MRFVSTAVLPFGRTDATWRSVVRSPVLLSFCLLTFCLRLDLVSPCCCVTGEEKFSLMRGGEISDGA